MFNSLLEKRRSIRKFKDKPVEQSKIDLLMEAALRSPSGKSGNPWEFVVVDDRQMLAKLSTSKPHGASFLKGAALGIVVCADQGKSDTCIEDCSIASIIIQLAAESIGLGSCWIQIRNRQHQDGQPAQQYVADLLGIPPTCMVQSIMAIGYPAETKEGRKKKDLHFEKVHQGSFGSRMYS